MPLGLELSGTFPQWGTFLTVLTGLIGLITVYIRGMPERHRVRIEERKIDVAAHSTQLQQYADQITEFRKEVHGYRNELHVVQRNLEKAESLSRRRGDRIVALTIVVKLVMSELKRLDPDSLILGQAEQLLTQMIEEDRPETAADAARQTLEAAERTVEKVTKET